MGKTRARARAVDDEGRLPQSFKRQSLWVEINVIFVVFFPGFALIPLVFLWFSLFMKWFDLVLLVNCNFKIKTITTSNHEQGVRKTTAQDHQRHTHFCKYLVSMCRLHQLISLSIDSLWCLHCLHPSSMRDIPTDLLLSGNHPTGRLDIT